MRLLASLTHTDDCAITHPGTVRPTDSLQTRSRIERELRALARAEESGQHDVVIEEVKERGVVGDRTMPLIRLGGRRAGSRPEGPGNRRLRAWHHRLWPR